MTKWPFTKILCLLFGLLLLSIPPAQAEGPLNIINIDVGQGSSTLILGPSSPSGKRISVLIDAGPVMTKGKDIGHRIAHILAKNGVKTLDVFIATHYDPDHLGGILSGGPLGSSFLDGPDGKPQTQDDIGVSNFIDRGDISDMEFTTENLTFDEYKDLIETATGKRRSIRANDLMLNTKHCHKAISTQEKVNCFNIDLGDGAYMETLTSNGFVREGKKQTRHTSSENERSLSFLLSYHRFHSFIGGDLSGQDGTISVKIEDNAAIEKEIGKYLEKRGVQVDVLNVNDSASKNSTTHSFLKRIRPKIAVISVGNNKQNQPTRGALRRLIEVGVHRIYQTGRGRTKQPLSLSISQRQEFVNDDIVITTDGQTYKIVDDQYKTNR